MTAKGGVLNNIRGSQRHRPLWTLAAALVLAGLCFPSGTKVLANEPPALPAGSPVPTRWEPIGPTVDGSPVRDSSLLAGRVSAVAVIPGNKPVELIGTLGGIWRRVGGRPWNDVTDARWPSTAIGSIAVDPSNPKIVYAGTGYDNIDDSDVQPGGGILKSFNGGQTWIPMQASEHFLRGYAVTGLAVDPTNDAIVVAAANNGVFLSLDRGRLWREVLRLQSQPSQTAEVRLSVDPVTGIMLLGVAQGHSIAANWEGTRILTGHAMYRSANGGRTWTPFAVDSGTGGGDVLVPAIATDRESRRSYAYALDVNGTDSNGLYVSGNRGLTWRRKTSANVAGKFSIGQMAVDPLSPTHVFFAQERGPYEYTWDSSTDSPVTTSDGSSCQFGDWRTLALGPTFDAPLALYGGTDGGPCVYDLSRQRFSNQSAGLISGIDYFGSAASSGLEISGAQDLGVDTYRGGPLREVYHADAYGVLIDRNNPAVYYAGVNGFQGVGFDVSTDSGATWNPVALPGPAPGAPYLVRLEQASGDPRVLILSEPNGTLYVSNSDGQKWAARTIAGLGGDYLTAVRAALIPGAALPVIYAGTGFGHLWRSTNLGSTWTELDVRFPLSVKDIAIVISRFTRPSTEQLFIALGVYAPQDYATSSAVGDVQESTDSGANWIDIGQSLSGTSVNALLVDGTTLLAGTNNGVEIDARGTWSPAGSHFPNVRVNDIFLSWDNRTFFATTYGRGTWESPASRLLP